MLVLGVQGDLVDKYLSEDFSNLAAVLVTGRANVLEFVHTVLSVDINQNGVAIRIRHPAFLQTMNKLRQLGRRRRKRKIRKRKIRKRKIRKRKKQRRWTCLEETLGE